MVLVGPCLAIAPALLFLQMLTMRSCLRESSRASIRARKEGIELCTIRAIAITTARKALPGVEFDRRGLYIVLNVG